MTDEQWIRKYSHCRTLHDVIKCAKSMGGGVSSTRITRSAFHREVDKIRDELRRRENG